MKKTLIALTLAALPVAASADVVLYGQIKAGVEISKVKLSDQLASDLGVESKSKTATEIADFGSRVGFKGHEHLTDDLNAIWQVEANTKIASTNTKIASKNQDAGYFSNRESFIGLESKTAGKIRAGKIATQLKDMDTIDPWEYSNNALGLGVFTRTGERVTSVRYDTPVWGGFSANVQYTPRDNANPDDKYTHNDPSKAAAYAGLNYENAGWFAQYGFGYKGHNADNANKELKAGYAHQVQIGYNANNLLAVLGGQYTKNWDTLGSYSNAFSNNYLNGTTAYDADKDSYTFLMGNTGVKTTELATTVAYRFGNVTPRISYAHGFKPKLDGGEKVDLAYNQVVVGADYDFSKRTTALISAGWLRAGKGDYKITNTAGLVGLRHKF